MSLVVHLPHCVWSAFVFCTPVSYSFLTISRKADAFPAMRYFRMHWRSSLSLFSCSCEPHAWLPFRRSEGMRFPLLFGLRGSRFLALFMRPTRRTIPSRKRTSPPQSQMRLWMRKILFMDKIWYELGSVCSMRASNSYSVLCTRDEWRNACFLGGFLDAEKWMFGFSE